MTQTAVVSGGTYGIGRAVVMMLARRGYKVAILGRNAAHAKETSELLRSEGVEAEMFTCDMSQPEGTRRTAATVLERLDGQVDVLVNNAATRVVGTIVDTSYEDWDRLINVNLRGAFALTKEMIQPMIARGGGVIVNVGSPSGWGGWNHIAYCVSKGALIPFTKCLALDHAEHRIRVNAVLPGLTLTGMTEERPPEARAAWKDANAAGRVGAAEDIANAIAYLISPEAEIVSGAVLEVGTLPGIPVRAATG
jgi:NAD(P)-dependent dehydrogenase (short-subunit alcohol dehydrogenase family)